MIKERAYDTVYTATVICTSTELLSNKLYIRTLYTDVINLNFFLMSILH